MTPSTSPAHDHAIVHRSAPLRWHEGLPLGNGDLGVMVWGDGSPLSFTLDKADLWDLRSDDTYLRHPDFSYQALLRLAREKSFEELDEVFEHRQSQSNPIAPTKIYLGRAELPLGQVVGYECRLCLGTATVEGVVRTEAAEHSVRCFVHREHSVLCLRVGNVPPGGAMRVLSLAETNEPLTQLGHPDATRSPGESPAVMCQPVLEGPFCAVAWNPSGPDFFLAVATAPRAADAEREAARLWADAQAKGFDALYEEHVEAWSAFWECSAVYLPEERMEFLWYYGLYLLASSSRRGSLPPGLQGLWAMDGELPPWRGDYHGDMNVQETFWPAFASGHLDLADSWIDLMHDSMDAAQAFTRRFFGTEGTFWPCATLPGFTVVPGWHTVQYAWSSVGWLAWLVWLRWRHSMDLDWLEATGYPLVAETLKFYRVNLESGDDGLLHVPLSSSPEYRENRFDAWCRDPNVDIALIHRCCDWVEEMEMALGRHELSASARHVRGRLPALALSEGNALCLWPGKMLDESHRHPSQLMPIHPAMMLTVDDPDAAPIISASVEQYMSLGQYAWAGHTYAQMVSLAAVIGRGELAYDCLLRFAEYWIGPNGLHFNRETRGTGSSRFHGTDLKFTMEASNGVSAGISDMLVQGWGDVVRVFPAVPAHWSDAAFRGLVTEGAFRVSAARVDGRTVWVQVEAGVDRELRLRDPFGPRPFTVTGPSVRCEGDLLLVELSRGETVTLCAEGEGGAFDRAERGTRSGEPSRLGLR